MINAIVAVDNNWGIGSNNKLLANIPEDMKFFKEKTMNSIVIIGRKTYESLPKKPLPNRTNVVITSNIDKENVLEVKKDGVVYVNMDTLKSILPYISINTFIIGGGMIYKELLPYCEQVYVTHIYKTYDNADTFFPNIDDMPEWEVEWTSEIKEYNNTYYQFLTYKNKEHTTND